MISRPLSKRLRRWEHRQYSGEGKNCMFSVILHLFLMFLLIRSLWIVIRPIAWVKTAIWCVNHPCWPRRDLSTIFWNHLLAWVPLLHGTLMAWQILTDPTPYTSIERWKWVGGEMLGDLMVLVVLFPLRLVGISGPLYRWLKRQTHGRCCLWCQELAFPAHIQAWADARARVEGCQQCEDTPSSGETEF